MRRSRNVGVALVGLLVVAAISVTAGSGRKPAEAQQGTASLRRLSGSEVMDIINKFPEMVPSYFAEQRNDTGFLKTLFPFCEVTSTLLDRAFPGVRFFKGTDFGRSEGGSPYLMAIAGDKRYVMPGRSNYLLLDGGQKVTDKNITELAKAFVILAVGSEVSFPEINFLDAKRTRHTINTRTYDFTLTAKIGEQVEVWYFSLWQNQFSLVYRSNAKGLILEYQPVMVESLPGRGQLDPTPNMIIGTSPTSGDAYVEFDSAKLAHYYVIVKRNQDSTGKKVVFSLYGFPPDSHNVREFRGHNKRLYIRLGRLVLPWPMRTGFLRSEVAASRLFQACDELVVSQRPAGAVVPTQRSQFCRVRFLSKVLTPVGYPLKHRPDLHEAVILSLHVRSGT